MPARLEGSQLRGRRGDAGLSGDIGKGHQSIGVADVERVTDQRHAERLVQVFQERLLDFGHAIAIGVAQQSDPIRALPHRGCPAHRRRHRVVEHVPHHGARHARGFRDQHIAVRQHLNPARMLKAAGERVDLQPGIRRRHLPWRPTLRRRHFQRRDHALRPSRRNRRGTAPGRFGHALRQLPRHPRGATNHSHDFRENT